MTRNRLHVIPQFTPRPGMVRWYDPGQLLRTAGEVVVSSLFARNADRRLATPPAEADPTKLWFDYTEVTPSSPREEIWIDYVADLGDGWDSTYTVAHALSQRVLDVADPAPSPAPAGAPRKTGPARHQTLRGDILIFGGDQVYPVASRAEYEARLIRPYEAALRDSAPPHPDLFAIPGNHDWYDSLVDFTRLFCSGRWLAGWKTRQRRSYFALKLPHGWWLIGTDVQLSADIDEPQLAYFREVERHMGTTDRIILCTARPHWIYARAYGERDDNYSERNLAFLEERVFGRKIAVFLSGDLHHYRRHADDDGRQKITSGGGGAFLHPTNGPDVSALSGGFTLKSAFPSTTESAALAWRNLAFGALNPTFGFVTGLLYLLLAWSVKVNLATTDLGGLGLALRNTALAVLQSQLAIFLGTLVLLGFTLFTETHSRAYRFIAGPLHAFAHLAAAFAIAWAASYATVTHLDLRFESIAQLLATGALIFALGWLVGPAILGAYLLISLNVFGRHSGEAFSPLRVADWKHFLRLRVTRDALWIYPVGFRRVTRAWRIDPGGVERAEWVPDESAPARRRGSGPELIEPPILISAPAVSIPPDIAALAPARAASTTHPH